jgi:hypothetical protein
MANNGRKCRLSLFRQAAPEADAALGETSQFHPPLSTAKRMLAKEQSFTMVLTVFKPMGAGINDEID